MPSLKTPKYTIKQSVTGTVELPDSVAARQLIIKDLNKKGFAVFIDNFKPNNGGDVIFSFNDKLFVMGDDESGGDISAYDQDDLTNERYFEDETELFVVQLNDAQIKQINDALIPPVNVGTFNGRDVMVAGDRITIGCQNSTKDEVVALAKAILKHYKVRA